MGSQSSEFESFSSDSFDTEIRKESPKIQEISIFLQQYPFISNPIEFLEKIDQSYILSSGDVVLSVISTAHYTDISKCLDKRFKKNVAHLIEETKSDDCKDPRIGFLFCPRIVNVPVDKVYELYKSLDIVYDYYIIVSRLSKVDADEQIELTKAFPEIQKNELKFFPVFNDEIFLYTTKIKQNTEINGSPAKLYLASKKELQGYLKCFLDEISN